MKRSAVTVAVHDRSIQLFGGSNQVQRADLAAASLTLSADELADSIADLFPDSPSGTIALILPASWCYIQKFRVAANRPTRTMLHYALEEFLPVDIESLTCDFIRSGPGEFIGVALEAARGRTLLQALAARGIRVGRISIDVLEFGARSMPFVWCDNNHVTFADLSDGILSTVRTTRFRDGISGAERLEQVGAAIPEAIRNQSFAVTGSGITLELAAIAESLGANATPVQLGSPARWVRDFDLARDAIAPAERAIATWRAMRGTAAALLATGLLLCAALIINRIQAAHQLRAIESWERGVFAELFPNAPVPAGIAARISSERRRLESLTRSPAGPDSPEDAARTLATIVQAIPKQIRLDLQELRIEGSDVFLRGRTREPVDAERISQCLDQLPGFDCSPTRTDRQRDGVTFTVQIKRSAEDAHGDR